MEQMPSGDFNQCKGKEGYPSVCFEVITGYDHQVLGVSSVNFGTRNDLRIVRTDETVSLICTGWYENMEWHYFDKEDYEIYLICDSGYLHWPQLVCPFTHEDVLKVFTKMSQMCLHSEEEMEDS